MKKESRFNLGSLSQDLSQTENADLVDQQSFRENNLDLVLMRLRLV